MNESKSNIPKLRFPGFTGPWEQRKLGELYEPISEKNDGSYGINRVISVANMYFKADAKVSDKSYLSTYNVMRIGDIAFEGNRSGGFAHGRLVENDIGDGIVSHVFKVFRPIGDYDLSYWKYAINNESVMGPILVHTRSRVTMMHELVPRDFLMKAFVFPLRWQSSVESAPSSVPSTTLSPFASVSLIIPS